MLNDVREVRIRDLFSALSAQFGLVPDGFRDEIKSYARDVVEEKQAMEKKSAFDRRDAETFDGSDKCAGFSEVDDCFYMYDGID